MSKPSSIASHPPIETVRKSRVLDSCEVVLPALAPAKQILLASHFDSVVAAKESLLMYSIIAMQSFKTSGSFACGARRWSGATMAILRAFAAVLR